MAVINNGPHHQLNVKACRDSTGGAIIAYENGTSYGAPKDIIVNRIDSDGNTLWGKGINICNTTGERNSINICPDGQGGAFITWVDHRNGNNDLFAQRVDNSGVPQWTANGTAVSNDIRQIDSPCILQDGNNCILTWTLIDGGFDYNIYATKIDDCGNNLWGANGTCITNASDG
ncbi:MAG: hypothetical protein GF364_10595 [Candidatus Lokiarchaeota archaeon]|nr:hypothetical protein [Candidatus Lokiarchaeota archaeon]